MKQLFTNNAETTVNGSIGISDPTIVVAATTGADFPTPTAGDYFLATIYEINGVGAEINHEVVKVTARVSDTMTVVRAFDNTVARAYPDNVTNNPSQVVYFSLRWTAYAAGNVLYQDDNLASVASAATSRTNLGLGSIATQNANNVAITGGSISGTSVSGITLTSLDTNTTIQDDGDPTKQFKFEASGITAGQTRVMTIPDANATLVGTATTQTLTSKTIALGSNTVSGTLAQFNTAVTDADLVSIAGAETLTNKTLTSPTISGGSISGITDLAIADGGTGASTAADALVNLGERTGATGSVKLPVGTELQRDGTPAAGYIRFNSDADQFEGYNGTAWGSIGGGATGGGGDQVFMENDQTVTTNYTITSGRNAVTAGPIQINSGITVTIPSGSTWHIL